MSDSADPLLIGVDGGGTGCRAAIGTRSKGIVARAQGGAANASSDPDQAIKNIMTTIQSAAVQARVTLADAWVHLGLAGVMTDADSARVAQALPFEHVAVTGDRTTAVTGALGGQDGYLLSIGTGTIVAANIQGAMRFVGGWGFHVSDQASGAWLGHAALKQVVLCHDGLANHTALTRAIFAEFGNDTRAIVEFCLSAKPGNYGALAPQIVTAAQEGDIWGRAILQDGADYLTQGLTTLGLKPGDPLCLMGGVGPHYAPYLPPAFLSGQIPPKGDALDGAFALAKAAQQAAP